MHTHKTIKIFLILMIILQSCSGHRIIQSKTKMSDGSYFISTILEYEDKFPLVWLGFYKKNQVDSVKKAMKKNAKSYIDYYDFKKLQEK
jgi:hypothetical protein